jgi:hypothetical protein
MLQKFTLVIILRTGINCKNGERRIQESGARRGIQNFERVFRSLIAFKIVFRQKLPPKTQNFDDSAQNQSF